jgi:hypothetical protein
MAQSVRFQSAIGPSLISLRPDRALAHWLKSNFIAAVIRFEAMLL